MLKYPCLVLDHDDTVVQSEATINYPFFVYILDQFRPGTTITWEEYLRGCCDLGFAEMCRQNYSFTEQELADEYRGWKEFIRTHTPPPYPGIADIIRRQKAEGGMICVVSHSSEEIIRRDYSTHFGIQPDAVYGWDLPEHQRKPSAYPLEHIMDQYSFAAGELLVVDDLKPAWEMASKVGVKTALAAWSKTDVPEITQELTKLFDYSFHSPKELENFLFD
jgi:phosphoglycolate phosphatase/pyrophosphatase PpaX